jgi:hypothetical protein
MPLPAVAPFWAAAHWAREACLIGLVLAVLIRSMAQPPIPSAAECAGGVASLRVVFAVFLLVALTRLAGCSVNHDLLSHLGPLVGHLHKSAHYTS